MQGHRRPAPLAPGEGAGIELHEGAHARFRGAPRPILARAAAVLGGQAQGAAEALDGGATDGQPFPLAQLLSGVAVIDVPVRRLQQLARAAAEGGRQPPGRGPAAQTVPQARGAVGPVADLEALDVPHAEA